MKTTVKDKAHYIFVPRVENVPEYSHGISRLSQGLCFCSCGNSLCSTQAASSSCLWVSYLLPSQSENLVFTFLSVITRNHFLAKEHQHCRICLQLPPIACIPFSTVDSHSALVMGLEWSDGWSPRFPFIPNHCVFMPITFHFRFQYAFKVTWSTMSLSFDGAFSLTLLLKPELSFSLTESLSPEFCLRNLTDWSILRPFQMPFFYQDCLYFIQRVFLLQMWWTYDLMVSPFIMIEGVICVKWSSLCSPCV